MNRVFYRSCEAMLEIPDGVVQTCVTSPPYFGLRDYGTATWEGGDRDCTHIASERYYTEKTAAGSSAEAFSEAGEANAERLKKGRWRELGSCTKCGAVRKDEQIGLEPTLDAYVDRLVRVFREVKRVLRDDGTLWLNLGDSYAANRSYQCKQTAHGGEYEVGERYSDQPVRVPEGLKPKDLIGVPWAVAFALRADGWWLRSDIVWHKVPCMPESIEDRPTRAHEFIFLLSKSARYFYDADAIREPVTESDAVTWESRKANGAPMRHGLDGQMKAEGVHVGTHKNGANKRDVWRIAPAQYSEAHFATFPPEIPSLCIRAGSKPGDLVLDPFAGSGTTLEVAESLGRAWVGYELNLAYKPLIEARLRQQGLFTAGNA